MARLTMALAAVLCFLAPVAATQTSRKGIASPDRHGIAAYAREVVSTSSKDQEMVITDKTEIKLDGRACRYKDVPSNATVLLLEVAGNKKTILKIHFQTQK